jgi:hypothetical protein
MRQLFILVLYAFSFFCSCASSDKNSAAPGPKNNSHDKADPTGNTMKIKIGSQTFIARLYDNSTTAAFKAMLPMTLNMVELNRNEKYAELSSELPANALNPGTIKTGDLMLYGSNTLVLFYKTFSTSYSYTKLGRIDDAEGLPDAVGSGNVTVRFEAE